MMIGPEPMIRMLSMSVRRGKIGVLGRRPRARRVEGLPRASPNWCQLTGWQPAPRAGTLPRMPRRPPAVLLAAAVALLAAACASPPPAAPDLLLTRTHRAGTAAVDPDPAAALALTIEWRWVTASSDAGLVPVGSHASAVISSAAFGAAPLIASEVRVALGEAARGVAARLAA